jgi:undecaprenyl-diphosphatase
MSYISGKFFWIPFYAFLFFLLIKQNIKNKKKLIISIISVVLVIVLADQLSVHLFKNVFERLRPCHNPDLKGVLHTINGKCGGQFGFISSHAANVFALAVLLLNIFKNEKLTISLIVWATIVSYSRIYLGVHYFGDVLVGAIFGAVIGYAVYGLAKIFSRDSIQST